MKNLLIIISLLTILIGCNKEENNEVIETLPKILEYSPTTMFYPNPILFDTDPDNRKIKLIYTDEGKISRRIGYLLPTPMGYKPYMFLGDTITYYQDSIVIELQLLSTVDFSELTVFPKRKLITRNGYIEKEIYFYDYYGKNHDDTLLYSYNIKNQIDEITQIQSYSYRKKYKFKYDGNDNLNIVTSVRYKSWEPVSRDTMWFLDYDDSPNLAKDLIIFPECFYRSLSTNNFRKYIHKSYRVSDSLLISTEEKTWEFSYDENNFPIY